MAQIYRCDRCRARFPGDKVQPDHRCPLCNEGVTPDHQGMFNAISEAESRLLRIINEEIRRIGRETGARVRQVDLEMDRDRLQVEGVYLYLDWRGGMDHDAG